MNPYIDHILYILPFRFLSVLFEVNTLLKICVMSSYQTIKFVYVRQRRVAM